MFQHLEREDEIDAGVGALGQTAVGLDALVGRPVEIGADIGAAGGDDQAFVGS